MEATGFRLIRSAGTLYGDDMHSTLRRGTPYLSARAGDAALEGLGASAFYAWEGTICILQDNSFYAVPPPDVHLLCANPTKRLVAGAGPRVARRGEALGSGYSDPPSR